MKGRWMGLWVLAVLIATIPLGSLLTITILGVPLSPKAIMRSLSMWPVLLFIMPVVSVIMLSEIFLLRRYLQPNVRASVMVAARCIIVIGVFSFIAVVLMLVGFAIAGAMFEP